VIFALAITAAVVAGDKVALRATPDRTGAQQAQLWKGDWLEVRGARKGWLQVYDHRHERPGWIAQQHVRVVELDDKAAPGLRAIVDFVRDQPGSESLGIAYAGLYMKVAPKIDASILVSLGTLADRLAQRASTSTEPNATEQLAVAQSWGIHFASIERDGVARICYDGEAFRQALALSPTPADTATAVLAVTDPACTKPTLAATERQQLDEARLALLERADPTRVAGSVGNKLRVRRAVIAAQLAWATARRGDLAGAAKSADAAASAYARVDKAELADDDAGDYQSAALAVAASRWAAMPVVEQKLALDVAAGQPGETCVAIKAKAADKRCTYGQVWTASLRVAPSGTAATLAVEPVPGWLELWLFRRAADGSWASEIIAPATDGPDLGYVELAGWSPDAARAVVVREARVDGAFRRTFQVVEVSTLEVVKQATTLAGTGAKSWTTADWRGRTLALR
jgi:hypothetical protein